jgi:hypothetical protein
LKSCQRSTQIIKNTTAAKLSPSQQNNKPHQKESHVKKTASVAILFTMLTASSFVFTQTARAEDVKMVGAISKIELPADGTTATAILKDNKTGESVTILVTDELTLDKFKDKRIVEGDEIRCKFEKQDGKNNSKMFKKTAGC